MPFLEVEAIADKVAKGSIEVLVPTEHQAIAPFEVSREVAPLDVILSDCATECFDKNEMFVQTKLYTGTVYPLTLLRPTENG